MHIFYGNCKKDVEKLGIQLRCPCVIFTAAVPPHVLVKVWLRERAIGGESWTSLRWEMLKKQHFYSKNSSQGLN